MTQPTPDPAPAPVDPTPAPVPAPVDPPFPTTDLTKTSWWQWALTTVISLAVGIGTLIGHPFDSNLVTAIVPSVALVAAAIATAFQVHGVHQTRVAVINYQREMHAASFWANHENQKIARGVA